MKTDKLYYQIFLSYPALLAELIPGLPADCEFEYVAPVVKESEFRLDGLLMPLTDNPNVPVVFLEAQMQPDNRFYGRYFAETHLYLYQYQINRPWRGLLILQSRQQQLGSETPYVILLDHQVQRLYLQDLLNESQLPLSLALLQLIVLSDESVPQAAKELIKTAKSQGEQAFQTTLEIIEAILINKFPQLSPQEVLVMLDIKTADFRQTRFYQDVFQEGREEGREEGEQKGEAKILLKLLKRRFGYLLEDQEAQVKALSLTQLDELGEVIFDLADLATLEEWLLAHPVAAEPPMQEE
jgi:predicted transposase/invertase (TIGR01784 family)